MNKTPPLANNRIMFQTGETEESHMRSFLKSLSWRFLATCMTGIIAFFVTGELMIALSIGSIEFVSKIVLYYFHERAWLLVPQRRLKPLKSDNNN